MDKPYLYRVTLRGGPRPLMEESEGLQRLPCQSPDASTEEDNWLIIIDTWANSMSEAVSIDHLDREGIDFADYPVKAELLEVEGRELKPCNRIVSITQWTPEGFQSLYLPEAAELDTIDTDEIVAMAKKR